MTSTRSLLSFSLFLLSLVAASASASVNIQHWQTDKGARVYFVESHDLPLLDVSVNFAAGSSHDTPAKAGLANLTRYMLSLGAGGMSDNAISQAIADVGASLDGRFDRDMAGMSLRTLSHERERTQALDVLAKVLQQPEFPQSVLDREKARIISAIKEADTQPESIADKAFYKLLYGDHPYALDPAGNVASVAALQQADLFQFYRAHYTANNAVVAIMGDVSRAQAEAIARQLTDNLPSGTGMDPALPPVALPDAERVEEIPHPASQSHILLGYPGMVRGDPDFYPLFVGNYVLGGGGFDSRLTKQVREKAGLAYSVYSYFLPMRAKGPFQIGLQTKKEQTGEALRIVRKVLKEFVANGPTEAELKQAKNNLIGGFPLRIDSNRKIVEYLAVIGFYRLPLTYLDDFIKNVGAVTVAQVRSAFARRIDPDRMSVVIVGGNAAPAVASAGEAAGQSR